MIAHDGIPGMTRLDRDALEQRASSEEPATVLAALSDCRAALERMMVDLRAEESRGPALQTAHVPVERFASLSAQHAVPPERMIVLLKRSISELSAVRSLVTTERDSLSRDLVEMAIAAYYDRGLQLKDRDGIRR